MTLTFPHAVRVVEVGPRDGLQNEAAILATDQKVRLISMLAASGLRDIEVSAFVHPDRVPQLADATAVWQAIDRVPGVRYSFLVPNMKGLDRAADAGVTAIAVFTAASNTFAQRNIGMTVDESLAIYRDMVPRARAAGMWVRAYVSTTWYCPFEGRVAPRAAVDVIMKLFELDVDEVSVGDTIGHAVPNEVADLFDAIPDDVPRNRLAGHFHDTRGAALANVVAAMQCGVAVFDSAVSGTGGCPFAPGASGNLATEDLVTMLDGMNIETGIDLTSLLAAGRFMREALDRAEMPKSVRATGG